MKRVRYRRLPAAGILLILFSQFTGGRSTAGDMLGLDASWQFSEQGMDSEEENNSAFSQRYHLLWSPEVTRAISLDANANYSRNWTAGAGTRETISPTLNALLQNDLFMMEFNGLVIETNPSDRANLSDRTWEGVIGSNWDYLYWPTLRMSFGQNWQRDSERVHKTDSDNEWYEFVAQWEADTLETYYSYYSQVRSDHVERSEYDDGRHFGRLDYSRAFHGDRGRFSIGQQITDSTTEFSAAVGEGESINVAVNVSQGLAGEDPIPEQGSLPANTALIDGNRNTAAFVIRQFVPVNLGVKTDMQRVDVLRIHTGELDPLHLDETAALRWDLYTSTDGIDWQRVRVNPPTTYNRDEFRYEVDVTGTESMYLKLVVTDWPPTLAVPVTEIEAYQRRTGGPGGQVAETQGFTKYLTDFTVSYAPITSVLASYSLVRDDDENEPGNDQERLFQGGSLEWQRSRYFIPTLTVNNTTTDNSESPDTLDRSYGLNIRSMPLPTLDATLSLTRNENYEDDEAISRNHTLNLLTSAVLYPNLESTLDLNVIFNDQEEADSSSRAYSVRWYLTGRLRPELTVDLITEYGINTLDFAEVADEEDTGGRTTLNVNYRPSDMLSFLFNASEGYGEKWSGYQSTLFDVSFAALRTAKTQVRLGYRINATEEETINSFNCNWSWNISPYLTLQTFANYLITEEENIWAVNARMSARF